MEGLNYTKNEWDRLGFEAGQALDFALDKVIWRTRLCIQQTIIDRNPNLIDNPFVVDNKRFVLMFMSLLYAGAIDVIMEHEISGDRKEISIHEPKNLKDLIQSGHDGIIAYFREIIGVGLFKSGLDCESSNRELKSNSLSLLERKISSTKLLGINTYRVYYRHASTGGNYIKDSRPLLLEHL